MSGDVRHVVVVGAGISGLTAAYRLHKAGLKCTLLESSSRFGGVIQSQRHDDCLLELGPDCWASNKPAAMDLAKELGIADQVIGTREGTRRSFILHQGKLKRLPEGFFLISPMSVKALIKTPILSLCGKIRMGLEPLVRARRDEHDESLAGFVRRRFGREALDRIAQPMVAGIYSADPEKLSLQATFPQFLQWEREQGSVIRALRRRARHHTAEAKAAGPRYGMFVSFRHGMSTLPEALAAALPEESLRLNTRVSVLRRVGDIWQVDTADETLRADAVVLAVPARISAHLLRDTDAEFAEVLSGIEYASAAVVNLVFKRSQISHPMDGIGAVIPAIEGREVIAFSFSHVKFEGRASEELAVVRVFMGGALRPEVETLSSTQLVETALNELRDLIGVAGDPLHAVAAVHRGAMPQYHVGHVDRVESVRRLQARHAGLVLLGNGFDGVGTPDCIRNANRETARLVDMVEAREAQREARSGTR